MSASKEPAVEKESGAEVTCPKCGTPNGRAREFCANCLTELSGAKAEAPATTAAPASAPEQTAAPVALSPDDPRCAIHPDQLALGPCSTCGAFYCEVCVPKPLPRSPRECAACVEIRTRRLRAERTHRVYGELGWLVTLSGLLFASVTFVGAVSRHAEHLGVLVLGAFVWFLPMGILGLLTWAIERRWLAWVGAVPAMVLFGGCAGYLALLSRNELLWIALLWFPLLLMRMVVSRLLHLGEPARASAADAGPDSQAAAAP